jgi:hypothetical protein
LCGNGKVGPFFVRTKERKIKEMDIFSEDEDGYVCFVPVITAQGKSKNISCGERATLAYLRFMIHEKKFLRNGDVLIIDGESALCTDVVQEYLSQHQIYPFTLPSALHQLMNPCDNSFHSIFKQRYYRLISNSDEGNIGVKQKFLLAKQCFHEISEESISNMFLRCGLIPSDRNNHTIVTSLMCEGISNLDNHNQHHKKCLLAFLKWCKYNNLRHLCSIRINV